ncbi:hypothetical protein BH11PLA1_BH11PLA1_08250 [soil metagenome]
MITTRSFAPSAALTLIAAAALSTSALPTAADQTLAPNSCTVGPALTFVGIDLHGPALPKGTYTQFTLTTQWISSPANIAAPSPQWQDDQRVALHTADASGLLSIAGGAAFFGGTNGGFPTTYQPTAQSGPIAWVNKTLTQPFLADGARPLFLNLRNSWTGGGPADWTNISITLTGTPAPRCQPADIADDQGTALASVGTNSGVNEGDYNCFFNTFFTNQALNSPADIASDDGNPLPPFAPAGAPNSGVNEGDYNCFFNNFFNGC